MASQVTAAGERPALSAERIHRAAAELFRRKGYAATSVRDIARALGVTPAALYNHVTGKEELLAGILDHAMGIAEAHLEQALRGGGSWEERLRALVRHHALSVLDEDQPTMAVFFQEVALREGPASRAIGARRRAYQERFVEVLRRAAEAGAVETPDPRVTAYAVLGMCNWLHRWYDPRGRLSAEEISRHYAELVLRGILVERARGADGG